MSQQHGVRTKDTPVVDVRGVVKCYDDLAAVDGVDLTVGHGVIHGLVGPNGAGKTTLLAMLFGLVGFDEGSITVCGARRPRRPSGVLPGVAGFLESPSFYPYLTARRNLQLLAAYDGAGRGADRSVDGALEAVSLTERAASRVGGFSVGMRQRLGIAAALIRAPQVLILDEPGNGLDPNGVRDLHALLRALAADGVTVLLSSHDMDEVEALADSVTIMRRGAVAFDGTIAAMREQAPAPSYLLRTGDDEHALRVAATIPGLGAHVHADPTMEAGGLLVDAERSDLDAFVIALGKADVAVRALRLQSTALRSFFHALTETDTDPRPALEPVA